jgi:uncharacterized protein YkwD
LYDPTYYTQPWHSVPNITQAAPIVPLNYYYNQCLQDYQTVPRYYQEYDLVFDSFNTPRHFPYPTNIPVEWQMVSLINQERQKAGKSRLSRSYRLFQVAAAKAKDMANIGRCPAEHYSPTFGGDEGTMLKNAGITASNFGWIIYCGRPGSFNEAVNWWMNISTSGHRENILNSNFNRFGVGSAVSRDGTRYWSVIFSS